MQRSREALESCCRLALGPTQPWPQVPRLWHRAEVSRAWIAHVCYVRLVSRPSETVRHNMHRVCAEECSAPHVMGCLDGRSCCSCGRHGCAAAWLCHAHRQGMWRWPAWLLSCLLRVCSSPQHKGYVPLRSGRPMALVLRPMHDSFFTRPLCELFP